MLEIINEPLTGNSAVNSLRETYYPAAYKVCSPTLQSRLILTCTQAIRQVEADNQVSPGKALHIQMMSSLWGSDDPTEHLDDKTNTAFNDHRYVKHDSSVNLNKDAYIKTSCNDDRSSSDGVSIVG